MSCVSSFCCDVVWPLGFGYDRIEQEGQPRAYLSPPKNIRPRLCGRSMTDDAGSRRPKGFKIRWKGTPRNRGHQSFCRGATTRYAGAVLRCPGRASGGSTPVLPLLRRSYAPLSGYVQTPFFSFSPWLLDGATLLLYYFLCTHPHNSSTHSVLVLFGDLAFPRSNFIRVFVCFVAEPEPPPRNSG